WMPKRDIRVLSGIDGAAVCGDELAVVRNGRCVFELPDQSTGECSHKRMLQKPLLPDIEGPIPIVEVRWFEAQRLACTHERRVLGFALQRFQFSAFADFSRNGIGFLSIGCFPARSDGARIDDPQFAGELADLKAPLAIAIEAKGWYGHLGKVIRRDPGFLAH